MIPLNYHHLYYFYVVAKAGSIAQGRKTLLLSQSAVSTQLKQLERSLGHPLFEHRQHRLHLTEKGRFVLDYAESIFGLGRELQAALKGRPEAGRPVYTVGVGLGTPRAFSHALMECILSELPSAHVLVREGPMEELLAQIRDQRLDLLLTHESPHAEDRRVLSHHLVAKIPIHFAAAPGLARRHGLVPGGLHGAPFLLPAWSSRLYSQVLDLLAEWEVEPRVVAEVQDAELARRLAVSGRGIATLNAFTIAANMPAKSLMVLRTKKAINLYEAAYLVSRRRKYPTPLVAQMVKSFRLPVPPA